MTYLNGLLRSALLAAMLIGTSSGVRAATVFSNGTFVGGNGNGLSGFLDNQFNLAGGGSVTGANVFVYGYNGLLTNPATFDGTINYRISTDVGGNPGTVIASGTATGLTGTSLGLVTSRAYYEVSLSFASAFDATPGTDYFFGIDSPGSLIIWGYANPCVYCGPGPGSYSGFAFELTGDAIPEPASMGVLGAAFAGLGLARRRRKLRAAVASRP